MDLWEIAGIVVVGVLGVTAGLWKAWKHIPGEIAEAFMEISNAVEDDNITREELKKIVDRWYGLFNSIRTLLGK